MPSIFVSPSVAKTSSQVILECLAELHKKVDNLEASNRDRYEEEEEFIVQLDCERELHDFDERLKNKEAGLKQKMVIIYP